MAGMQILIADDNATMRAMIERVVERVGVFGIDFAGNGNEALRFYRQQHHDLMIIDNIMPQKNGIDVLKELHDDPLIHKSHVIMITDTVTKELGGIIRSEYLKIDDLIVKPIDFEKLKEKINNVAARVRARNRDKGPILNEQNSRQIPSPTIPTLSAEIVDRGNIAIIDIKGHLRNDNRNIINSCLKRLETIGASTIIIDINGVESMDDFGYGTMAIMNGWIAIQGKEAFLACDDCAMMSGIAALGINHLPKCPQGIDSLVSAP